MSSSSADGALTPALLNNRSTRPKCETVFLKRARTESTLVTSAETAIPIPAKAAPECDVPAEDNEVSNASRRRPANTTLNQLLRRVAATDLPIPEPAPVTIATLDGVFIFGFVVQLSEVQVRMLIGKHHEQLRFRFGCYCTRFVNILEVTIDIHAALPRPSAVPETRDQNSRVK